jgi:hypothetical protein
MRIEAGAYQGKPVYFELIGPWTWPQRMQTFQATAGLQTFEVIGIVLLLSLLVGGAWLARRNLRAGRSDRRGAARLATVVFAAAADAGRDAQVLHVLSAGADHPFSLGHPEGEYLKGVGLKVL